MKKIGTGIKYKAFTVEEFLQDDFFIRSITHPNTESDQFWEKLIHEGNLNLHEYHSARNFILSIQVQSETLSNDEKQVIWKRVQSDNSLYIKRKSKQKYLRRIFVASSGIAAAIAILVLWNVFPRTETPDELAAQSTTIESIAAPDEPVTEIQLVVNNDKTIVIEGEEAEITYSDEKVTVANEHRASKSETLPPAAVFNQLIVPFGKRSTLTLADGSKIWLNAGTRVVYPAVFAKDKREIFVDGEIFADITYNENWPFVVKTKNLSAEVLGTSFDVNAYESDDEKSIVLVSGKLQVNMEQGNTILVPNQMLLHNNDNTFHVATVNPVGYTAWKEGRLQYQSEDLSIILKRLSRYYGREIECSSAVSGLKCSGKLLLRDDLQTVLNCIALTAPIDIRNENEKYVITYK
ncbi:MAG: FecR domain-containing protein [Candidatus Symbiothrix sp.]|jgi:hypothetical protein|nr:FecR domain-containing protein [Candidatus Symbiothrix sp.]